MEYEHGSLEQSFFLLESWDLALCWVANFWEALDPFGIPITIRLTLILVVDILLAQVCRVPVGNILVVKRFGAVFSFIKILRFALQHVSHLVW